MQTQGGHGSHVWRIGGFTPSLGGPRAMTRKLSKRRFWEVAASLSKEELEGVVRGCKALIKTDMQPKRLYWDGGEAADPKGFGE